MTKTNCCYTCERLSEFINKCNVQYANSYRKNDTYGELMLFFYSRVAAFGCLGSVQILHLGLRLLQHEGTKRPDGSTHRIRSVECDKYSDQDCCCVVHGLLPRHQHQRKPQVSNPGMHHGTCVTRVPWCMLVSLTRGGGGTFQVFLMHAHHVM